MRHNEMERRALRRYPLSLRAVICPRSGSTILQTAQTRNISTHGVYLLVKGKFNPKETFDLTVSFQTDDDTHMQFHAAAKVVRIETFSRQIGVAVTISDCDIARREPFK